MNNNYLTDVEFNVGTYIRLSQEDRDKDKKYESDSESVANQKELLRDYVKKNNFNLVNEYVDDGFSGTDFDRPGFASMIEDIKNKIIENSYNLELEYVSKEAAQNRIKENLGEKGNVLNGYTTSNNPAPASIEIKTDAKIEEVAESIQSMPGIAFIATHQNTNPYGLFFHQALKK